MNDKKDKIDHTQVLVSIIESVTANQVSMAEAVRENTTAVREQNEVIQASVKNSEKLNGQMQDLNNYLELLNQKGISDIEIKKTTIASKWNFKGILVTALATVIIAFMSGASTCYISQQQHKQEIMKLKTTAPVIQSKEEKDAK